AIGAGGGTGTLKLGAGANVLRTDSVVVAGTGSGGTLGFAGPTGTLMIRNSAGNGRADVSFAAATGSGASGTGGFTAASVSLGGHAVDILAGSLLLGTEARTSATSGVQSLVSFDAGTIDVTSLGMAVRSGTTTTSLISTLTVGGTGVLRVGTGGFTMSSNPNASAFTNSATLSITGGVVESDSDILKGSTTGTASATISLQGGTLDLKGHDLGSAAKPITFTTTTGTLQNVNTINGTAGITKSATGTLTLAGVNNYTGATTVSNGALA